MKSFLTNTCQRAYDYVLTDGSLKGWNYLKCATSINSQKSDRQPVHFGHYKPEKSMHRHTGLFWLFFCCWLSFLCPAIFL